MKQMTDWGSTGCTGYVYHGKSSKKFNPFASSGSLQRQHSLNLQRELAFGSFLQATSARLASGQGQ